MRELFESSSWTEDPALGKRSSARAWIDPRDRALLVFENGRGRLYESWVELARWLEALPTAQHVLDGRFPQGARFLGEVRSLVAALPRMLGLPASALDLGLESLERIDEVARARGTEPFLEPPLFPAVVAYVGEVVVRAKRARWEMVRAPGGQWEPWVVLEDGRRFPPFVTVLEEALDHARDFSLHGVTRGFVGGNGP